jgi:GrpB-like predicted nucleotidyltransferase (UPF0157 family)
VDKAEQVRLLHRLQKEIGDFGGEPMLKRLRRWRDVRSPEIEMVQMAYRLEWAEAFAAEAQRITLALGRDDIHVHHFGSSAIPGMASKPVLDMAVAVPSAQARREVVDCLLSLGYVAWGESPIAIDTEWFWRVQHGGIQRVVHVCASGDPWLIGALNFRDYLRVFPEQRAAYEAMKLKLAAEQNTDITVYTLKKTLLMYGIIAEANAWRSRRDAAE